MNSKVQSYIRQFGQAYEGGNWLGESFVEKLNGVTGHQAFLAPAVSIHSVAELVWHCTYWRIVTLHRLQGDAAYRDRTLEELNWLPLAELQKIGWNQLRQELSQTQDKLIALLREKQDHFLDGEYQPGLTFDYLLEGTLQHDNYHLGQIGLVIKMISTGT